VKANRILVTNTRVKPEAEGKDQRLQFPHFTAWAVEDLVEGLHSTQLTKLGERAKLLFLPPIAGLSARALFGVRSVYGQIAFWRTIWN